MDQGDAAFEVGLEEFVRYRRKYLCGDEKGDAQDLQRWLSSPLFDGEVAGDLTVENLQLPGLTVGTAPGAVSHAYS